MPMHRREFFKASVAATGTGLAGLTSLPVTQSLASPSETPSPGSSEKPFSLSIREYLSREAQKITDRALADYRDAAAWRRLVPERRTQFLEMMGLEKLPPPGQRTALNVKVTGVVERARYRIEKLYYESLPKLYVTANLYIPNNLTSRAPAVLYVCGHSEKQKVHYQTHARRFAELGFVSLIVETIQLGEARGYHHGCYYEGWFHWYSRGYTPAGMELLNGIRGLDLLVERPEVDASRLGVTGISGGGATSWWVAAGDERVRAAAPTCGTASLASHIADLTVDGHCDCMWWTNTYRWDLADVGALIAPRALMIASADHDDIFTISSIRKVHEQLQRLYRMIGAEENLRLVVTPGGHGYHQRSRTAIFSWFLKHLQGKDIPPEQVGDIDDAPEKQEAEATLRVFVNGPPPGDRALTIQEDFFTPPELPSIKDRAELEEVRGRVANALREKTFGAFPAAPPPLDVKVEVESTGGGNSLGTRFAFNSDEGWRLRGRLTLAGSVRPPAAAVVALRLPGEKRSGHEDDTEEFLGRMHAPWAKVVVEPRGTGETAWGEELQWHLRRATAWTGRTLASMWVYDALRALEAVRSLPQVDGKQVALAARGEMAAVALYAALLDGRVVAVVVEDSPATQNAPSQRDGRGPALEMLNCLRVTDLPQVAGLLYPTQLVFAGEYPTTYAWAEDLYNRLGAPEKFRRVGDLTSWQVT
jgi:cephalosporin-C deacetylase-like acetyl esterase